jgi:hypothetical protein
MHGVLVSDRISGLYLIPGYPLRSAPPEIVPKPEEGGEDHRSGVLLLLVAFIDSRPDEFAMAEQWLSPCRSSR